MNETKIEYWDKKQKLIKATTPYKNGEVHGKCKYFYPNGMIEDEINYVNDKLHGVNKSFWENGNLAVTYMKKSKLFFIISSAILAIAYFFTLSLLFSGCSNETEQNNTQVAQVTNSSIKANSDMSAGIITIDGKQVNLGEIPLPTKQPSQFTITPKLLYALAYKASGVTTNAIVLSHLYSKEQIDSTISDIWMKTGIKPQYKIVNTREDSNGKFNDIALLALTQEELYKVANYLIEKNTSFNAGLAQLNSFGFSPVLSDEEFVKSMTDTNYKSRLTITVETLFEPKFQYKTMTDRLLYCDKEMKTIDGVLECLYSKDNEYYKDTIEYTNAVYDIGNNDQNLSSHQIYDKSSKQVLDEMRAKEANGAYKGKFNNFQTTYKKLFGSEYKLRVRR